MISSHLCALLWLDAAAVAVQLGAFFDDQGRGGDLAFDFGSAAEDEFLAGKNVTLDGAVDFCDRHFDDGFRDLRAGADDECSVRRGYVAGEVTIDSQHRFEAHFAREIHHVTHETKPIVFVYVGSMAINECRLAAFVSARHCLSSHWLLPLFNSVRLPAGYYLGGWEAAGVPPPLLKKRNYLTNHTITPASDSGVLRLDCRSKTSRQDFQDEHDGKDEVSIRRGVNALVRVVPFRSTTEEGRNRGGEGQHCCRRCGSA